MDKNETYRSERKETYRDERKEAYRDPVVQAYQILHIGFTLLPILAGLDKFISFFAVWEKYLSSAFNVFGNAHTTMLVVGVIEIIAGIGVWFKPRVFAYVVALWLLAIIINLLILGHFFDVALRDFGLLLGALALGRLSETRRALKVPLTPFEPKTPYESKTPKV